MKRAGRGPGHLRIVAGELRGRRIRLKPNSAVRPTSDRVREALFSILGSRVVDARVLDAYSGSGALGFEALSRGARRVVFLEADDSVLRALGENAAALGLSGRSELRHGPAEKLLREAPAGERYDLILADPPYASGQAEIFLPLVARRLEPEGLLVFERDLGDESERHVAQGLILVRTAAYGRNCLDFYRRASDEA